MKIGVGADHHGFQLKEAIKSYVESLGHQVKDYSRKTAEEVDYPGIAFAVAQGVLDQEVERGILICGTGIGVAMAANKIPGIRAAQIPDTYSAERAQLSNNAQIVTLGGKTMGEEVALKVVGEYLSHSFVPSPSSRKIDQIMAKEQENLGKGGEE